MMAEGTVDWSVVQMAEYSDDTKDACLVAMMDVLKAVSMVE